ncbi:MAG: RNA-binding protein, partial [Polyangiaceae bacterium]
MLKRLFQFAGKSNQANTMNEAGGKAYAFSPEHALAQYAVTGTIHNTFYATAEDQLEKLLALAKNVSTEFVAKTALYTRTRSYMKDTPAVLVAYLAKNDVALMKATFPRVIDNGKMLRNFVQVIRSGVVGRKSFGTAPKRAAQAWFKDRSPDVIFRSSLGQSPSMADVIKMVRPSPKNEKGEKDETRDALYAYLIGKEANAEKLPAIIRAFEAFKKGNAENGAPLPDVPFEMLTALELT